MRRTSTHCPRGSQHRGRLWRPSPRHLSLRGEEKTAAGLQFLSGRSSPPRGTPADHWPLLSRVPTKRHPKRKRILSKRLTPWLHHEGLFLRRQDSPSYFSKPPANRAPHRTSSRQRPAAGGLGGARVPLPASLLGRGRPRWRGGSPWAAGRARRHSPEGFHCKITCTRASASCSSSSAKLGAQANRQRRAQGRPQFQATASSAMQTSDDTTNTK